MRLEILHIAGCAGARELEERLREVLADRPGIELCSREVRSADEAAAAGMAGSPTLLADGVDVFAASAEAVGTVSCRIYRDETGGFAGAPTPERLREVLDLHGIG